MTYKLLLLALTFLAWGLSLKAFIRGGTWVVLGMALLVLVTLPLSGLLFIAFF